MKLIDKDALVAEVEKLYDEAPSWDDSRYYVGRVLDIIDTLEVKEVDLEKEIEMFSMDLAMKENNGDWEKDIAVTAKHFFELGLKAQKYETNII